MSFALLSISLSGINAAQKALEVAGHNVANANTDGYTRQRIELKTANARSVGAGVGSDGGLGLGVKVEDVIRIRSTFADASYRGETALNGYHNARTEVFRRVEHVLGPVDSGLPAALDEFWASWDRLSLAPDDTASRTSVLNAADALASSFRSADGNLTRITEDTAGQIGEAVDEVNDLVAEVARLNGAVADIAIEGRSPNDLMDERDRLVDRLANLVGARTEPADSLGRVDVYLGSRALVQSERFEELAAAGTVPEGVTWAIGGRVANTGGRVGALVEVGQNVIPGLRSELDALAAGLSDTVNTVHQAGFDLDGNAGLEFFTGTSAVDFGLNPAVSTRQVAASQSGAALDGNNALAIADLRDAATVGSDSARQAVQALAGRLGNLTLDAERNARASDSLMQHHERERAETSSVSIDEELASMIRYQRAYEAAAKMISVADGMLSRLVDGIGLGG